MESRYMEKNMARQKQADMMSLPGLQSFWERDGNRQRKGWEYRFGGSGGNIVGGDEIGDGFGSWWPGIWGWSSCWANERKWVIGKWVLVLLDSYHTSQ